MNLKKCKVNINNLLLTCVLAFILPIVSACASLDQTIVCIAQPNAELIRERPDVVNGERISEDADVFEGHRTKLGRNVVITIEKLHGINHRGLLEDQHDGHWRGELVSFELPNDEFENAKRQTIMLRDVLPAVSLLTSGFYYFYPFENAVFMPNTQSHFKRIGNRLEGSLFVTAKMGVIGEPYNLKLDFNCKVRMLERHDVNVCMGAPPANSWGECAALTTAHWENSSRKKFCWNFPESCKDFLAQDHPYIADIKK